MSKLGHQRWRESLSEYIDNRLEGRRPAELERHMATCASCREELAALRETVQALRQLPSVAPRRSFSLPRQVAAPMPLWFGTLRLATAVVALFFVVTVSLDLARFMYSGSTMRAEAPLPTASTQTYGQTLEAERGLKAEVPAPLTTPTAAPTATPPRLAAQKAASDAAATATPPPTTKPLPTPEEKAAEEMTAVLASEPVISGGGPLTVFNLMETSLLLATVILLTLTVWRGRLEQRF